MGTHAGSKGASPPSSLRANIPWSFECLCLKFVPSHVLEPPSSSAYVDALAPFMAFLQWRLGARVGAATSAGVASLLLETCAPSAGGLGACRHSRLGELELLEMGRWAGL
ncbi:unnamed protein product [Prunus armeniaca]